MLSLFFTAAVLGLPTKAPPPPTAKQILAAISQEYIQTAINKLPTFGTRHSLSDATSPTRGVGAARTWIKGQFESFNFDGGSKLQVSFEEFDPPVRGRVTA